MQNYRLFNQGRDDGVVKRRFNSGFTFIELILYTGLIAIFLTGAVYFAWHVVYGQIRSSVQQEVAENLRSVSERLKFEIRNAYEINNLGSDFIELDSGAMGTTTIALESGAVQITQNGVTNSLTSSDVEVTGLSFTNLTTADQESKNIKFSLTIRHKNPSGKKEWSKEETLEGTVELRSN